MALLPAGLGFLYAGAVGKIDSLHAARGALPDFVAAKETNRLAASLANCTVCRSRTDDGFDRSVVGTLSHGYPRPDVRARGAGAFNRGYSRGMVLSGVVILASEADFHLSAVDDHAERPPGVHLARCRHCLVRSDLFCQTAPRTELGGRCGVFYRDPRSGAGIHHALHVSLHVRGRPLSVSRLHRPDRAGFGWSREIHRVGAVWAPVSLLTLHFDLWRAGNTYLAAKRGLSRHRDTLANDHRAESRFLDGRT